MGLRESAWGCDCVRFSMECARISITIASDTRFVPELVFYCANLDRPLKHYQPMLREANGFPSIGKLTKNCAPVH